MAKDTYRIRIKRNGSIVFFSQQIGEERLRLLREMLEDSLGPVVEMRSDDDGTPGGVRLTSEEAQKDQIEQQNK
jgi:hypothetical protein